jgi:thiol:disulfide interchange protein/DsbC/DsbD-like thiol-disulfide interchange protein
MPTLLRRLPTFLPPPAAFALVLAILGAFLPAAARAQVQASLVAAETSIQPGRAFTVALRLVHEPKWHTYWINAGTGYATSLDWQLPPGWTAGPIEWPTPHVVRDTAGNIAGNGYEGDTLLPVTITPPADLTPGEPITLRAKADWLMCERVCKPGRADVSLTLPVSAAPPKPDPALRAAFAAIPVPAPADDFTFTATRSGKTITLTVSGTRIAALARPHVFTTDALVQYDEPQQSSAKAERLTLTLPVSPAYDGKGDKLLGVLAYTPPSGGHRGLILDVPITPGPPPASDGSRPSRLASSPGETATSGGGLAGTLALAFLGGLILNLMPCVFPVLGIKILGFVNQAGADRRKVTLHGLVFTAGVLLSFWALAGLLAVLRAGGDQLGWGFQLQSPAFVFILAAVMLVFALSLSGVFEFGLRATGVGADLQSKSGYTGSFFTGILATVVATPCSAPFLAPALGTALALPVAQSFAVFTAIALGLSLPYLLLSIFPQAIKILPRPGAWMETFKQFMAFPLYATVALLIWVLAGQSNQDGQEYTLLYVLFGLTLIALGAWWYGRFNAPGARPARARLGLLGGLALLAAGAFLGWPRAAAPTDLVWEKWSPEAVAKIQAEGKTAYVDFTARWCFTCQTNKAAVFGSSDVKKQIRDQNIVLLKADWTNQDPQITAELARFNRSAVPFNLIYKPGRPEPLILPELLTPGIVLDALR